MLWRRRHALATDGAISSAETRAAPRQIGPLGLETLTAFVFGVAAPRIIIGHVMELTRMHASRALRSIAFVVGTIAAGGASAAAPGLVVDVDSGKVLYAERATDPWFPASVTKLMTAYVALDMVRSGRASMDKLLTMAEEAAAQPPSKMGFKPGTQITLDNALKIIMVKSANDIAHTIAENLGGSVDGFAAMMNEASLR